jgi:hypothetical protein
MTNIINKICFSFFIFSFIKINIIGVIDYY